MYRPTGVDTQKAVATVTYRYVHIPTGAARDVGLLELQLAKPI